MQTDRTVPVMCVVSAVLWTLTMVLIFAGTVTAVASESERGFAVSMSVMAHGLACSAAAATVTIRNMLKSQNRMLEDAFALGRDHAATPMRRRQ